MSDTDPRPVEPCETPRPFADLRETGMLWLVNRTVFHPRGFALALAIDDAGKAIGWELHGDGREVWRFDEEADDAAFRRASAFLAASRRGRPAARHDPATVQQNSDLSWPERPDTDGPVLWRPFNPLDPTTSVPPIGGRYAREGLDAVVHE